MLLPAPDYLEFQLSHLGTCVITDDGSPLTEQVAQRLSDQGWPVVVLQFPDTLVKPAALSAIAERLPLTVADQTLAESSLQQQLLTIAQTHGSIHTFIHLHPQDPVCDKGLVKAVFLLAKQLQPFLVQGNPHERRSFVTVTRLDGELGLGGSSRAVSGGLFGLTKTLRLEWPTVFCRAVDIAPELSTVEAANALLAELHDPNVFIREVGHGRSGRMTLTCLAEAAY